MRITNLIRYWFRAADVPTFDSVLLPDAPFYAVGDVHGCLTEMTSLWAKVDPNIPVVMVGDYVDRGPQTRDVLDALFARKDDPSLICLSGNHEMMLLEFLDDPAKYGARWLRHGGVQTLASYGIGDVTPDTQAAAARALVQEMGLDLITWLRDLPVIWQSGNVIVVHAGADPALPVAVQDPQILRWGHKAFATTSRADGTWVVHGHTVVADAHTIAGRIAIDTGAYATGRLTAAHIATGAVTFLST